MIPFFLFAVACFVLYSIWNQKRQKYDEVFSTASKRLNLALSSEGQLFRRPWLHGARGGLEIDAGPVAPTDGGIAQLMRYRISFRKPVDLSLEEFGKTRRRLIGILPVNFQECEVDREGISFTRSRVPDTASELVSDLELLLREAEALEKTAAEARKGDEFVVPVPVNTLEISRQEKRKSGSPPPLPLRTAASLEVTEAGAEPVPASQAVTSLVAEKEDETESMASIFELVTEPGEAPAPLSSLDRVCLDLFATGRNRYEIGRTFGAAHLGVEVTGTGILRKVDRYSHDRIFGRGPGLIAVIGVKVIDPDGERPVPLEVTLSARLPAGTQSPAARTGTRVTVCGTLMKCDPFTSTLFLDASLLE